MSEHDHTDWKALADEIERKDRRLAEAQSAIRTLVEAMQRLGVFHDSLREHPAIARVLPQARAMTDFTDQWANRHDPDCEGTGRIDGHAYCSCYRRWLEGRLGEFMALYPDLRQLINAFRQEAESWSEWDKSVNDRLMDLGNLLTPKGAGE
jgi:hypothetical protein